MKLVYLDLNFIITAYNKTEIKEKLMLMKKFFQFVYSPAHIEEIYKTMKSNNSNYAQSTKGLISLISELTDNNELLPSEKGIICVKEDPLKCLERVGSFDSRDRVETDSNLRFKHNTKFYSEMLKEDKHNQNISQISYDKIWEHSMVLSLINDYNNNRDIIISKYNNSPEVSVLSLLGVDKRLPKSFCLERNNYESILKNSHKLLEYTVEVLYNCLNQCGYNSEKKELEKYISSTHDVTHMIYATEAPYLLSMDKRFINKSKAIYYYLGVSTQAIYFKPNNLIADLDSFVRNYNCD